MSRYIVTRQVYWYAGDGDPVGVEIALDDQETWNPGALSAKYPDDFFTSDDPREIVAAAIRLRTAWRKDLDREQPIAFTFSFNDLVYPGLHEEDTIYDLSRWADRVYAEMSKCDWCGEIITEEWKHFDYSEEKFCREYCVDEFELDQHRSMPIDWCDDPENCIVHCEEVTHP